MMIHMGRNFEEKNHKSVDLPVSHVTTLRGYERSETNKYVEILCIIFECLKRLTLLSS